jgi:hypothetical protein
MNFKTVWFCAFLFLYSVGSYANSKIFFPDFRSMAIPPILPIRQAKILAVAQKVWFDQVGDHMEKQSVIVCQKSGVIDVYDLRSAPGSFQQNPFTTCDVQTDQGKVTLQFYSALVLLKGPLPGVPFPVGAMQEYKIVDSSLYVKNDSTGDYDIQEGISPLIGSLDIENKSFIEVLAPYEVTNCMASPQQGSKCTANRPFFFEAFETIED